MFHLPVKGGRKEDRVSLLVEQGNNVLSLCGGRKTVQGPLNHGSKLFNTVLNAKALSEREIERVV